MAKTLKKKNEQKSVGFFFQRKLKKESRKSEIEYQNIYSL